MDWVEDTLSRSAYKFHLSGGQRRLKEAILYVCKACEDLDYFGAIKLNKILWRSDFQSFKDRMVPVTGRQYQRLKMGPAPVEMPPVINEMLRDGLLRIELREMGQFTEKRHIALEDPVMRYFSPEDLEYIDEAIEHYRIMTGTETSDSSHGTAWKTRKNGDPMPYQSAFLEDAPLPDEALKKFELMGIERRWRSQ
ncbi:Panacea domain-containing protein [Roseibium sp. Sym1]|uniref:Panacea domain-containing protein n=1 Tax=Roseibium sp. Sym1 TaxID=3016006 RepID=UPI0022B2D974|nr:Panacea domain-containing protein [Roseibium sp. Sym1]